MISCEDVKKILESSFPNSTIIVENPRNDDVHFRIMIESSGFKDKNLVEQHQMVYKALGNKFGDCGHPLHAVEIKTKIKNG